jgi:hypothetical protein
MSRRGLNWGGVRKRDAVRRLGHEGKRSEAPFMAPLLPAKSRRAPVKSKEQLRADAVRAFMEWRARRAAEKVAE